MIWFSKYNNTDNILKLYTTPILIFCDKRFKLLKTCIFLVTFGSNNLSIVSKTIPKPFENLQQDRWTNKQVNIVRFTDQSTLYEIHYQFCCAPYVQFSFVIICFADVKIVL